MNELENAAQLLGSKGGQTTKKKHGIEHYQKMNKASVKERRRRKALKLAKKQAKNLSTSGDLTSGSK